MRAALSLMAMCLAAACTTPPPHVVETCAAVATSGADVDAVRAMEARAARVNTEGWTLAEVVQVYAPEFQQVRPDGAVNSIDEALGDFTNGRTSPWAARYEIMDLDVRVYGCTSASVVGTAEVLPRGASAPMRWRFTNTWRNEDGAWRLARNQYVAVPRS